MRWCWIGIAIVIGLGPASHARATNSAEARSISLDEALALARKNAPAMVQAEGQLRTGRARMRSSYAAFVPNLSLSAGTTRQFSGGDRTRIENGTVVTLPSTPWSYSAGFGANLALFEGGRRFFDLGQARAGLVSADANATLQRYNVDLDVKQHYFNVLAARESEAAANALVEQATQQLRAAVLRLRASTATKSDSLRSEIQLSNARLARLQARTDIDIANAGLTRAVGVSELLTAAETNPDPVDPPAIDEEELALLVENSPAMRQATAARDASRAARNTAWTDFLPSLNASYSRGGSGSGTDPVFAADELSYNGTFRLSLSLPLFNQLGREEQLVQRAVALDNAEASVRDARLGARESLTRFWGQLQTADQRVAGQTASVAAAEEDLRVQEQRYAIGESTLLDLLASQTQLRDARLALIRARYDRRISRAQLEALVGRDL